MDEPIIACASTQYWSETWFRKQHFMSRLSERRSVLYIEPSRSVLRSPPRGTPSDQRNSWFASRLRQEGPRLWVWTPPRGLPFWTHPSVSARQYAGWGSELRAEVTRLGFERVWLWLYQSLWVQACDALRPERLIFDLVDDLEAYEARAHSRRTVARSMRRALAESDLVFATSRVLAERFASETRAGRIEVVGNGVRDAWLADPPAPAPELRDLPRPLIGFVGAIFTYLDFQLLAQVARAFPEASLVLVGPIHDAGGAARLRQEPNVHLLGAKPQSEIPAYLAGFDVCLAPFRAGAVRRAVNPLKVYEYLALGKPVVSTPLDSLAGDAVARVLRFGEGASFIQAIRDALHDEEAARRNGTLDDRLRERRDAVRPHTWNELSARVESVLVEHERAWQRKESGAAG